MPDPLEPWRLTQAPWYRALGEECAMFEAAYASRLPVLLRHSPHAADHLCWRAKDFDEPHAMGIHQRDRKVRNNP